MAETVSIGRATTSRPDDGLLRHLRHERQEGHTVEGRERGVRVLHAEHAHGRDERAPEGLGAKAEPAQVEADG